MVSPDGVFIFMCLMHGFVAAFACIVNKRKRLRKRFLFLCAWMIGDFFYGAGKLAQAGSGRQWRADPASGRR
ncbi:hypothetical protein GCN74_05090 [Janthinobacterium sp. FT14W]|uniref:hypothetical protein n=1 Tax=Janthinobacterium sp. FT14W TaxID=2654253 RepID=UPI0012643008|nr:hypothetical protein [Janthinobacterium sp. FT14W]KAB8061445.1 hypothetical protein GCN74_05090 [Janthinobacterium sp. FT14W]